jgi:COP9 signalosome complex subunit 2
MSDDEEEYEYEYEYDDDADDDDDNNNNNNNNNTNNGDDNENKMDTTDNPFEYTDEEEDQDDAQVALENAYYNAKGMRENTNLQDAAQAFEQVIQQETQELGTTGPWSFKAIKQLVKLHLRANHSEETRKQYTRLLDCISTDVSPNAVEKGINAMLERVASLAPHDPLAVAVYDETLQVFHPTTGTCKNERLWFKANLKYGQLLYQLNQTVKLQKVLKDLQSIHEESNNSASSSSTLEIYALQIQLYSRQKDHKRLREIFNKAMAVRGGITHPRTLALMQELGGKMHMAAREYEPAGRTFFQAFKSYDEAGDPSRLRCLKYLVLASMLHASTINPFDSQEARPYRDDPEILAMTNLVQAFHNNEIQTFETILRQNQGRIMEDEFVREHIEDLLRTIRTQVLRRVIRPYKRISLQAIARELNDIPVKDVESLLVSLILDGSLDGKIDQVAGVLLKQSERGAATSTDVPQKASPVQERCHVIEEMTTRLEGLATQVTNMRLKEGPAMRGMVHG